MPEPCFPLEAVIRHVARRVARKQYGA